MISRIFRIGPKDNEKEKHAKPQEHVSIGPEAGYYDKDDDLDLALVGDDDRQDAYF